MNEIIERLNWKPVDVDVAEQPDTVVWRLVNAFNGSERNADTSLSRIRWIYLAYCRRVGEEVRRRLAAAANEENRDARVVLLEVEAQLPEELLVTQ